MTELTIHIGMNKTGTTALQKTLFHNRTALGRAGLLYPKAGLGSRLAGRGLHYRLSQAFLSGDPSAPCLVAGLLKEIDAADAEQAIVSSEFFVELRDVAALARCLSGRKVRILVYLRRHDHWVSSLFSQGVKSQLDPPWGPSVEAFIRHIRRNIAHYYVYSRLLSRWAKVFGPDAIDVKIYQGGDIVAEVLEDFGLNPASIPDFKSPSDRANSSPSRRQLAAIDHIQRAPYPAEVKTTLVKRILATEDRQEPGQLMTSETACALIEEHQEDYATIARDYLGRSDGVLFDEAAPEPGGPDRIALWPREGIEIMSQMLAETV